MDSGYVELGKKKMEFTAGITAMTETHLYFPSRRADRAQGDPTSRRNLELPKKGLAEKPQYLRRSGCGKLAIVAALFSSSGKEDARTTGRRKGQPPQPTLQDNTDSNVQELKNQIQAERQKERQATMAAAAMGDPALASTTPAQRTAAAAYGPTGVAAPVFRASPARNRSRVTCRCNSRPYNSRRS